MKWAADLDFRKNENKIQLPADAIRNNRPAPWERNRSGEGIKSSKIPEESEKEREDLTATYWG